jgi:NDP-sugar pyrophosphorylase family protein
MKVLVMCGGRGKRLGSLTEHIPKPLVEVRGRSILDLKVERYHKQGLRRFIFCTGYKGDLLRDAVESMPYDIDVEFSEAGEDAGIFKRLCHAKELLDEYALLTYGDTFAAMDFSDFWRTHIEQRNEVTIAVAPIQNPFGVVKFNEEHRVTSFEEKPVLDYYIGYAIISKSAFDFAPPSIIEMPDGSGLVAFFKVLIALGKLGVFYHSGLHINFNTQEELKAAEEKLGEFYTMF